MPPAMEAQIPNHWTAREVGFILEPAFCSWPRGGGEEDSDMPQHLRVEAGM